MQTALYIRVAAAPGNTEPQRTELREWAKLNAVTVAEEYEDIGHPGPGLAAMLKAVAMGAINRVLCVRIDRFGRKFADITHVLNVLEEHNCALVATSQGIDTSQKSGAGTMMLSMLAAVAEFEAAEQNSSSSD